jgi:hypothetical protein
MRDFDRVHNEMEKYDKSFVSKSLFTEDSIMRTWFEEIGLELVESTLNRSIGTPKWSKKTSKTISRTKLAELFAEDLNKLIQKKQQLNPDNFMVFFDTNEKYKYLIAPILKDLHMLNDFLLRVYKFSYKFKELSDNSFAIPAVCLEFCLGVLKKYYPSSRNYWIVRVIQGNLVKSFRNLIVGGRGTGRYYRVDSIPEVEMLLADFKVRFTKFGIQTPTKEEIRGELSDFIENHTLSEGKKAHLMKFIHQW